MLADGRAPRHVVHGPGARPATLGARAVVGHHAAAALAAQLPRVVAERPCAEDPLEQRRALPWPRRVRAHGLEALEGVLRRDLGVVGGKRLVARVAHQDLVPEALRVREADAAAGTALD